MKTATELKQIVKDYCISKGWGDSEATLEEALTCDEPIYREPAGGHRWWNDVFKVVNINGTLIGFIDAETTGDQSAREMGWSIDWNKLCEVEAKEVTMTVYERVKVDV
jgi:hypothetical protein